ncbi:hypothetical protein F53441_8508 [Fusarium austroafricanum]|uniref:GED domain-containing protein n=1 Tax=Fusarium austroafricanum TaxID=2364996 RepID=A0A8H4KEY3_9HYPO|nr:hypothetical protein F53441_8508 [Fusarium austroafricanum]
MSDDPKSSKRVESANGHRNPSTQQGDSTSTFAGSADLQDPSSSEGMVSATPQGEQSSGKSSLLRTLTDISFPVMAGIGTRFPIRVVSRRTAQGSRERFSIYVERAPQDVKGLQRADAAAETYRLEGDTLTMDAFEAALEDLSENYVGIRKGKGPGMKNFVPDIVTVDLSGPNRSLFNILDLPGLIFSDFGVNEPELLGTQELAKQYISRPENTIICTIPATSDLGVQRVFQICKDFISDKKRLIGVFTKCDKADREEAERTVVSAKSDIENGGSIFKDGMFVVCNKSPESRVSEDGIFNREPWSQISSERRGSTKLKDHLGDILTSEIQRAFPKLERDIQSRLKEKDASLKDIGDPRLEKSQKLAYLNHFVRKYSSSCTLALRRPGLLKSETMDLRQELNVMNTQFDNVMRWVGGFWKFDDEGTDPKDVCLKYGAFIDNIQDQPETAHQILCPTTKLTDYKNALKEIPAFEEHEHVEPFKRFEHTVEVNLRRFGASQPPGVVNSDIYPVIYRAQVSKWGSIAQEHLERVKDAMKSSYEEILRFVCPDSGSTSILHHELKTRLHLMFCETFNKAKQDLEVYCAQETQKELLQTTDPQFPSRLEAWRMLRYARTFYQGIGGEKAQNLISSETLSNMWSCMNLSSEHRMMYDIHDVIKVYYEISLESFIRHVTQTIVEGFVMDKDGPLSKLMTEYVLSLSDKEVSEITREDKVTGQLREQLKSDIMKLEGAQQIAKTARDKVEALKGI